MRDHPPYRESVFIFLNAPWSHARGLKSEPPPGKRAAVYSFRVVPETIDGWLSSSDSGGAD
jgi:hypothetical protein